MSCAERRAYAEVSRLQSWFEPDVVIVGAGLVGWVLATELLRVDPNVRVLVLEAGSWHNIADIKGSLSTHSFSDKARVERGQAGVGTRVSRKVFCAGHEGFLRPRMARSRAVS